jgi:hypothetical protein
MIIFPFRSQPELLRKMQKTKNAVVLTSWKSASVEKVDECGGQIDHTIFNVVTFAQNSNRSTDLWLSNWQTVGAPIIFLALSFALIMTFPNTFHECASNTTTFAKLKLTRSSQSNNSNQPASSKTKKNNPLVPAIKANPPQDHTLN